MQINCLRYIDPFVLVLFFIDPFLFLFCFSFRFLCFYGNTDFVGIFPDFKITVIVLTLKTAKYITNGKITFFSVFRQKRKSKTTNNKKRLTTEN